MKTLPVRDALHAVAEIGYDGVELCIMPGWPSDPAKLSASDRRDIRKLIADTGLGLPALQDNLPLAGTPEKRAFNLERLKLAAEMAHDLSPQNPPVLDTILGLKTAQWETDKGRMVQELKDWARVGESAGLTIAVKPHAAQALNSAEKALWLLKEAGSPRLRIVYDYSHFSVEGFGLEQSLRELLPKIALIAVKDAEGTPEKHVYLLPGDGKIDYVEYLRLLKKMEYNGYAAVEVSGMIHQKPGYQPVPTARLCYERLSKAFATAGIQRK